jgi:hypothetical protein
MNPLALSQFQFGFTAALHYLFPQLTMGLALLIVILRRSPCEAATSSVSVCSGGRLPSSWQSGTSPTCFAPSADKSHHRMGTATDDSPSTPGGGSARASKTRACRQAPRLPQRT